MAHRDIVLTSSPTRYELAASTATLSIARPSGEISFGNEKGGGGGGVPVAGILGMLRLQFDRYLLVITRARQVGSLTGHVVYVMEAFDLLPMRARTATDVDEQQYLALVRAHLHGGQFYFSHTLDLTNSLQRQHGQQGPLWRRADERFFWNRYIMEDFIQAGMDGFILPVVYGFFAIHRVLLRGHAVTLALCTRRSRYRAGTRYFSRGIDAEGHVSNFNETEQILLLGPNESTALAYVQTRGSMPAYWAEVINLRYKPWLRILSSEAEAAALHFQEQTAVYGRVVCVNLVNQRGHELPVKSTYEKIVQSLKANVKYVYFDFHNECRGLRWDRVQVLIDQLRGDFMEAGYFMLDGERSRVQSGVMRTNCMDCLDRTNVVQSSLARWTVDRQLLDMSILRPGESVAQDTAFETTYRNGEHTHSSSLLIESVGRQCRRCVPYLQRDRSPKDRFHAPGQTNQSGRRARLCQLCHSLHPEQLPRRAAAGWV